MFRSTAARLAFVLVFAAPGLIGCSAEVAETEETIEEKHTGRALLASCRTAKLFVDQYHDIVGQIYDPGTGINHPVRLVPRKAKGGCWHRAPGSVNNQWAHFDQTKHEYKAGPFYDNTVTTTIQLWKDVETNGHALGTCKPPADNRGELAIYGPVSAVTSCHFLNMSLLTQLHSHTWR